MSSLVRSPGERKDALAQARNLKMARSSHAYVRGSTQQFYTWLEALKRGAVPEGPAIWICGDCHVGNLGPLADKSGKIEVGIRDLDQTVIGNPAHDLIRLALSLASAARGSDLPGVMTARMLEAMIDGYLAAFGESAPRGEQPPPSIHTVVKRALQRTWRHLAKERIRGTSPTIPQGKRFWPLTAQERAELSALVGTPTIQELATCLKDRKGDVALLDAAYWVKGCSSLGRLRYCLLVSVGSKKPDLCLLDLKEAIAPAAPRAEGVVLPADPAHRVIEGARHLSPALGSRMTSAEIGGRSMFVRELLPQDLKIELQILPSSEAAGIARHLAYIVGSAHARQMDEAQRRSWTRDLKSSHAADLDAPSWLWTSVVDLLALHERAYLEHCRRFALGVDI